MVSVTDNVHAVALRRGHHQCDAACADGQRFHARWCWNRASVAIAGFIINGDSPKRVIVRALGPSLTGLGWPEP